MKRDWPPEIALSCYKEENQVNMHQENKGLSSINQSYLFFLFFYCCNCSFEHYYFNHKRMDSHIELNYFRKYISKGIDMCNDPSYFKYIINKCNWVEWKVACWNRYIIEIKQTENFHSFFFRDIFFHETTSCISSHHFAAFLVTRQKLTKEPLSTQEESLKIYIRYLNKELTEKYVNICFRLW